MNLDTTSRLEIVCLGTGTTDTSVYEGSPSTSYAVVLGSVPILLVGAGPGTVRQCLKFFGCVPRAVFVHNNRSHQAAELPVMLSAERTRGNPLTVIAEVHVAYRLQAYRLAELHDGLRAIGRTIDNLADFVPLQALNETAPAATGRRGTNLDAASDGGGGGVQAPLQAAAATTTGNIPSLPSHYELLPGIFVATLTGAQFSERSTALAVYVGESFAKSERVLAIAGDSGARPAYYDALCHATPGDRTRLVMLDAREHGSSEHSSFVDVAQALTTMAPPLPQVLVGSYGNAQDAALAAGALRGTARAAFDGCTVTLMPLAGVDPPFALAPAISALERRLAGLGKGSNGEGGATKEASPAQRLSSVPIVPIRAWGQQQQHQQDVPQQQQPLAVVGTSQNSATAAAAQPPAMVAHATPGRQVGVAGGGLSSSKGGGSARSSSRGGHPATTLVVSPRSNFSGMSSSSSAGGGGGDHPPSMPPATARSTGGGGYRVVNGERPTASARNARVDPYEHLYPPPLLTEAEVEEQKTRRYRHTARQEMASIARDAWSSKTSPPRGGALVTNRSEGSPTAAGDGAVMPPLVNPLGAAGSQYPQREVSPSARLTTQQQQQASASRLQHPTYPTSNPAECAPCKIFVFNNEEKSQAATLLMVQQFRTVEQVKAKISRVLGLKPIGDIVDVTTGRPIVKMAEFKHNESVVATKLGGDPFTPLDLPEVLSRKLLGQDNGLASHRHAKQRESFV